MHLLNPFNFFDLSIVLVIYQVIKVCMLLFLVELEDDAGRMAQECRQFPLQRCRPVDLYSSLG